MLSIPGFNYSLDSSSNLRLSSNRFYSYRLVSLDKITIKSLKFHGLHGYYAHEREDGNEFEVDITAKGPFRQAIHDNNLDLTFNYEWVEDIVAEIIKGKKEKLIEALCFNIGEKLFKKASHVQNLIVTVRKLEPPIKTPAAYAEITMKWKR